MRGSMFDGWRKAFLAVFVPMGLAGLPAAAGAQEAADPPPQALKVGLYVSPPFVVEEDGRFTGMAVELWETIAAELGLRSDYRSVPTLGELVQATVDGEFDIALTNLTITENRAQRMDFTHPWYDAGLRIMVNEDQGTSFSALVAGLRESGHLKAYSWLVFVILTATVLLTLFDRQFDREFPRRWRDGLAESFYSVMSIATSGRSPGRKNLFGWIGRIWQGLWLVCGIAVLAYLTSSVTSVMTTLSLTNQINSVADLPGKAVGVFTGSVTEEYARESGLASRPYRNLDEAVEALIDGGIAAIIADAPVLEYYALRNPDQPVAVVGPIFEPDKYGFGLQHSSDLTRPLTVEIIGAHESGILEELRVKYFGER
ncbi:transporter substrate-binding domain-containing protein [Nitratireductor luteus]|uniref:transporter substrate-binding domain-containing protein n=1 Tax=Nitratireductor luteus TaxID=2976980 RepID=UPI00223FC5E8|nr:transporter substrate-binding domain-containing protein [Nitratireductor luteus]